MIFTSMDQGKAEILAVNIDGKNVRKLAEVKAPFAVFAVSPLLK